MEFCYVCCDLSALTDTLEILLQTNPEQLSVMLHTLSSFTTSLNTDNRSGNSVM